MDNKSKLALVYIRNGEETIFPVKDIKHAIRLADAIADSDLLNDTIDFNAFDVCQYYVERAGGCISLHIGESWESEECENFEECWRGQR